MRQKYKKIDSPNKNLENAALFSISVFVIVITIHIS